MAVSMHRGRHMHTQNRITWQIVQRENRQPSTARYITSSNMAFVYIHVYDGQEGGNKSKVENTGSLLELYPQGI